MSEQTYPTFVVGVKWVQDGEHDPKYPKRHEGLPEGRIYNSTSLNKMYREERDVADIEREIRDEWWPKYAQSNLATMNPTEPEITVKNTGRETWCLGWFEHWTFDVGQTDAEALASFERYVSRYKHMQDGGYDTPGYRCLMGAEDRWRWNGDPSYDERTDPPCRCKHCREQGVIRIGH